MSRVNFGGHRWKIRELPSNVQEGDLVILLYSPSGPNHMARCVSLWPGHGIPNGIRIEARKPVIPYRVKR